MTTKTANGLIGSSSSAFPLPSLGLCVCARHVVQPSPNEHCLGYPCRISNALSLTLDVCLATFQPQLASVAFSPVPGVHMRWEPTRLKKKDHLMYALGRKNPD